MLFNINTTHICDRLEPNLADIGLHLRIPQRGRADPMAKLVCSGRRLVSYLVLTSIPRSLHRDHRGAIPLQYHGPVVRHRLLWHKARLPSHRRRDCELVRAPAPERVRWMARR